MRFQGTLILFVLCAGMAAFIYFYEIRGGEERRRAEEAEERIWAVSSADINEMTIHSSGERVKSHG